MPGEARGIDNVEMVTVGDGSSADPVVRPSAPGPPLPLEGLLVVDLTEGVAGPYCTKLLGGFGARVVKVERPTGDPARRRGPYRGGRPDPEMSGLFLHLNTDKEGIVVDLDRVEGAAVVRDLIRRADVLVESFRPGLLAEKGLDPSALLDLRPSLVVCSVTPFRPDRPVPGLRDDQHHDLRHGRTDELEHPSAGAHFHPGHNFDLSVTPPLVWRAAPTVGQDNAYVYKEILGVPDDEYARLEREGHIGDRYLFEDDG